MVAVLLSLSVSICAQKLEVDGLYYSVISSKDNTVEVISAGLDEYGYKGQYRSLGRYNKDIIIPERVNYNGVDYIVTRIGEGAFSHCFYLYTIDIPNTVNSIGKEAFAWCDRLSEAKIGDNVKSIGEFAFWECRNLSAISLPNSLNDIGSQAFMGCDRLQSVIIPNSVETLGNRVFMACDNLKCVTIPGGIKRMGYELFSDCNNLRHVEIGDGVTTIDYGVFANCTSLESISIPNSVTVMGTSAFSGCRNLKTASLSENMENISYGLFADCFRLESVNLPNNIKKINEKAFYGCKNLEFLTIPSSVSSIGASAFSGCMNLTIQLLSKEPIELKSNIGAISLEVPRGATVNYAKANYWKDADFIFANENGTKFFPSFLVKEDGRNVVNLEGDFEFGMEVAENQKIVIRPSDDLNIVRYVLKGSVDVSDTLETNGFYSFNPISYYKENVIHTFAFDVENYYMAQSGTLIDMVGVDNVDKLSGIKISGDVNGTDIMTIRKMTNLKYLDLSEAKIVNGGQSYYKDYVTSENTIGAYFFKEKDSFIKVILPNTIERIEMFSFEGCSNLRTMIIPQTVKSIDNSSFNGCNNIMSAIILCRTANFNLFPNIRCAVVGDEVEEVFWDCPNLIFFNIPNSVKYIGGFSSKYIRTIVIPNNVTRLGDFNCEMLTHVELPNHLSDLPRFSGCNNLTSLIIPDNIEIIKAQTFANCCNLKSVTIPNSINEIEYSAFQDCSSLQSISLPSSITNIAESMFRGCHDLQSIDIPDGVSKIDSWAFKDCTHLNEVNLPNSLTSIEGGAFSGCKDLKRLELPPKVLKLGIWAFAGSGLTSHSIPSNVMRIETGLYAGCYDLVKVTIEDSPDVISFGDKFVFDYSAIDSLYIGRNTSVEEYYDYTSSDVEMLNIKHITIGKNVTKLSNKLFDRYRVQKTVTSYNSTPPEIDESTFDKETYENVILYVPKGSKTLYWLHPYWENFKNIEEIEVSSDETIGDVNSDKKVNADDVVNVVNAIMDKQSDNNSTEAADVNGDGKVNIADIVSIVNEIMK